MQQERVEDTHFFNYAVKLKILLAINYSASDYVLIENKFSFRIHINTAI